MYAIWEYKKKNNINNYIPIISIFQYSNNKYFNIYRILNIENIKYTAY